MESQTVTRAPAKPGTIVKPPGAMNSAFDTGAAPGTGTSTKGRPPKTPRPPLPPLDVDALEIKTGVPIPEKSTGPGGSARVAQYAALWAKLPEGGCVELDRRHAESFYAWCKKHKHQVIVRVTGPEKKTVWKQAPGAAA